MAVPQLLRVTPFEVPIGSTTSLTITGLGLTGGTLNAPNGTVFGSPTITDTQITVTINVPQGRPFGAHFFNVVTSAGESNKLQLNYQGGTGIFTQETLYPLDPAHAAA